MKMRPVSFQAYAIDRLRNALLRRTETYIPECSCKTGKRGRKIEDGRAFERVYGLNRSTQGRRVYALMPEGRKL